MLHHQKLKLYCSLVTLFTCLFLFSNRVSAQDKQDVLIPYLKNGKWGLCTKEKVIKVISIYDNLNLEVPYYFAVENNAIKALDSQGRVVDSFQQFLRLGEDSFLCFRFSSHYDSSAIFTNNPNLMQFDTSFNVHLLHDNKSIRFVDGTVDALIAVKSISLINQSKPDFLFVNQNGKTGLYDIRKNHFLISPKYTKYHVINDNIVIAQDENGQMETWDLTFGKLKNNPNYLNENVTEIWSNGNYVRPTSGQSEKSRNSIRYKWDLVASTGKVLLSACQNLKANTETGIISCVDSINSNGEIYSLYDFNGKFLMKNVRKFKQDFTNLLSIYGLGYEQFVGLYNIKTKRFVWKNNNPDSVRVKLFTDMPIPKIEVDTITYFVNDQGKILDSYSNYRLNYVDAIQLAKTIQVFKPKSDFEPYREDKFVAIRANKKLTFQIYDEGYEKVDKMDDFLGNSSKGIYAFKKDGKWGFADIDHVIYPPEYDSVQLTQSYRNFLMTKNGMNYIYLPKANKILPATGYDDAIAYADHNYYLGIKYLDTLKRGENWSTCKRLKTRLDLIDSVGNVVYSKILKPEFNLDYALTKNNKIIERAEDSRYNYFYIYDPSKDTAVQIEKKFAGFESFQDLPVLLKFYNEDGNIDILIANSLLPIQHGNGERVFFTSEPVQFRNNKDTVNCIKLIEISEKENPDYLKILVNAPEKSMNPWIRTEKVIGYISIDGVLYVD